MGSTKPLVQIRFRFPVGWKPTRDEIENIGKAWLKTGATPSGVAIEPKVWSKTPPKDVRAYLRKRGVVFGCPGVVKCYADPRLTMHDYDGPDPPTIMEVSRLASIIQARVEWVEYDKTRRGWHMIIRWARKFKPAEVVAIQAILGSDPAREAFNLSRVLSGQARDRRWNILFECKVL